MNQTKPMVPLNQLLYGPYRKKEAEKSDGSKQPSKGISEKKSLEHKRCALCVCVYEGEREYSSAKVICMKAPHSSVSCPNYI